MPETGNQQRLVLEIMAPAWSDKEPLATRGLFEALHTLRDREPSYWKRQLGLGTAEPGYSAEIVANRAEASGSCGLFRLLGSTPSGGCWNHTGRISKYSKSKIINGPKITPCAA